jgi:hypothetical protein
MTTCTACGADVFAGVKFCGKCGAPSSAESRPVSRGLRTTMGCALLMVLLFVALVVSSLVSPQGNKPVAVQVTHAALGDTVSASIPAVCMNTERGFEEIVKWATVNDTEEMTRAMLRYGGMFIARGDLVKVIDSGFAKRRVRVLKTGRECWVVSEVVDR